MKTYKHNGVKLKRVKVDFFTCKGCYFKEKDIPCDDYPCTGNKNHIYKSQSEVTTHDLREIDRAEEEHAT